jgi:hypothetical protein
MLYIKGEIFEPKSGGEEFFSMEIPYYYRAEQDSWTGSIEGIKI